MSDKMTILRHNERTSKGRKEIIIVGFWCFLGFEFNNFLVVSVVCNITTNWKFVLSFRINGKKLPSPSTFSDVKIICTFYFKWTFCLVTLSTIVINILILKLYYSLCISKIDSIYRYCLTFSYKCHGVNNYGKKILYAKTEMISSTCVVWVSYAVRQRQSVDV